MAFVDRAPRRRGASIVYLRGVLEPTRAQRWAIALVATFTMAISYVDRQVLSVLAPTVTKALSIDEAQYGVLASAFSVAYLVGAPLAGRLIDHVGARRGLLAAVVLWSAIAAVHAIVPGFAILFLLRIALGLAEAPSFPGAVQTVHRALPPGERARGFGVLFTGSSIGAMIAAPLATALEARFGWRLAFLATALVGLIWIPLWLAVAWPARARRLLDVETSSVARPPALTVARHPAVLRAIVVVLATSPIMAFVLLWGAKFFVRSYGITQTDVGRYLWAPPLFFDAGAIVFGDLASRRTDPGPPRALFATATLLGLALFLAPATSSPATATVILGIAAAGVGGHFALLTADMLARVPPSVISLAGGCTAAAQSVAYIAASITIGFVVKASGRYDLIVIALGALTLPGCIVWLLWRPPPRVA